MMPHRWSPGSWAFAFVIALLTLGCLAGAGCARPAIEPAPMASIDRQDEARLVSEFQELERLYIEGALQTATRWIDEFLQRHPESRYQARIYAYRGDIARQLNHTEQALGWFSRALSREAELSPALIQWISLRKAQAEMSLGRFEAALQSMALVDTQQLAARDRLNFHESRAKAHLNVNQPVEALQEVLKAIEFDPKSIGVFRPTLDRAFEGIQDPLVLVQLEEKHSSSLIADRFLFELISRLYLQGQVTQAKFQSFRFLRQYGSSPYAAKVKGWTRDKELEIAEGAPVVGLLLPIDGKWKPLGEQLRQAVEMGFADKDIRIVAEDAPETVEGTIEAYKKLVKEHHALAVIGPVRVKGSAEVAALAEELGVPTLLLSRKDLAPNGFAFQIALTYRQQGREMARYWIRQKKKRRFALIGPRTPIAETELGIYWEEIERLGGTIQAYHLYPAGQTDFQGALGSLTGRDDIQGRAREYQIALAARSAKQKQSKRREKGLLLPPIVDFDVLWIADEAKQASLLLPTLAFMDITTVSTAGSAAWNTPESLSMLTAMKSPVFFADVFSPNSSSSLLRRFRERFKLLTGQEATALDAMAYDAASLLREALKIPATRKNRDRLREELIRLAEFEGVSGRIRIEKEGVSRALKLFSPNSEL